MTKATLVQPKYRRVDRLTFAFIAAATVILVIAPFTSFSYLKFSLTYFISLAIFTASWDLLYSYSGQLSLGHALPYGIGAFFTFILSLQFNLPPILSFALAPVVAAIVGGAVGASTIRLKPAYQAIALLLASQVLYWVTSSAYGQEGISPLNPEYALKKVIYPSTNELYFVGVFLFATSMLAMYFLEFSGLRLRLLAIKGDPLAAEMNGINVRYYKIIIFIVSSFFAGIAGAFTAIYTLHVDYTVFQVLNSVLPIAAAVFGGPGEIVGSIFGSGVLSQIIQLVPIWFSQAITYLIIGLMIILILRIYPDGAMGFVTKRRKKD
ncbi:MAG: branched-chain amino acid ABC transporter permease [Nitrososphaerales archaeon]